MAPIPRRSDMQYGGFLAVAICNHPLAVLNHDDDILAYALFQQGNLVDEYNSAPGYFEDHFSEPSGGNAALVTSLFGMPGDVKEVDRVLRERGDNGHSVEIDRHMALATALGWPDLEYTLGYGYVDGGDAETEWRRAA